MTLEQYDMLCRDFSQKAIDADLLMNIDKLTRYTGNDIYDENISLKNLGTVRKTELHDKIEFFRSLNGDFDFKINTEEKEKHYIYYDLTLVHSSSVCSEFDTFVLVSERPDKYFQHKPRKLFVYCVNYYGKGTKYLPSINKLKKDIRSGKYTQYKSMLYEFCGVYSLSRPNDKCDKMATFYTLVGIIDSFINYYPEISEIEVMQRSDNTYE